MSTPDAHNPAPAPGEVVPFPGAATAAVPTTPTPPAAAATDSPPAGWYDDGRGRNRWYDGQNWTDHYAPVAQQPVHSTGPMTSANLNVKREVSYVRQQQGHSIILHLFLGMLCLWINVIYISVSPNHYWHA